MKNPNDLAPIHRAVMTHSLPVVQQALSDGVDIDAVDREGRSALFYAIKDGELAIAGELIKHGANVNIQDNNGETPLHFASREYRPEEAKLLIVNGASSLLKDSNGNTALWRAVFDSRGRGDVIKVLLSAGADKKMKNKSGTSPEDLANRIANYDLTQFLD